MRCDRATANPPAAEPGRNRFSLMRAQDEIEAGRAGERPEIPVSRKEDRVIDTALAIRASPRRAFRRPASTLARNAPARCRQPGLTSFRS